MIRPVLFLVTLLASVSLHGESCTRGFITADYLVACPCADGPGGQVLLNDFDGDGRTDMGVWRRDRIVVLLNRGNGVFDPVETLLKTTDFMWYPTAADVTGDGRVDLLVTNSAMRLVYPGLEGGHFASQPIISFFSLTNPIGLHDLDGDGRAEEVGAAFTKLKIFTPSSAGAFREAAAIEVPDWLARRPDDFAVLDFDHDGKLDVVGWRKLATGVALDLFFNDGDFRFTRYVRKLAMDLHPSVMAGDVDGDGSDEIITADDAAIVILRSDGRGVIGVEKVPYQGQLPSRFNASEAADLDHDGRTDLVFAHLLGTIVMWGRSDPAAPYESSSFSFGGSTVRIADMNGDGVEDVVGTASGVLPVLYGRSGSRTLESVPLQPTRDGVLGVLEADVNEDGVADIITQSPPHVVYLARENGRYEAVAELSRAPWAVGDFDGDGHVDLYVRSDASVVRPEIRFGDGRGAFGAPVSLPGDGPFAGVVREDGRDVIILSLPIEGTGSVQRVRVSAAREITISEFLRHAALATNPFGNYVHAIDLDADGDFDLRTPKVDLLQTASGWNEVVTPRRDRFMVTDLRGDGTADDLVIWDSLTLSTHHATGGGEYADAGGLSFTGGGTLVAFGAVADLDLDGRAEILVFGSSGLEIYKQDEGSLKLSASYVTPLGALLVRDVNGDGFPDVLVVNDGGISTLTNSCAGSGLHVIADRTIAVGQPVTVRVYAQRAWTAAMTVRRNGAVLCSTNLTDFGTGKCTVSDLPAGTHVLEVEYAARDKRFQLRRSVEVRVVPAAAKRRASRH